MRSVLKWKEIGILENGNGKWMSALGFRRRIRSSCHLVSGKMRWTGSPLQENAKITPLEIIIPNVQLQLDLIILCMTYLKSNFTFHHFTKKCWVDASLFWWHLTLGIKTLNFQYTITVTGFIMYIIWSCTKPSILSMNNKSTFLYSCVQSFCYIFLNSHRFIWPSPCDWLRS